MKGLLKEISGCTICLPHLDHGVNPVLSASSKSKIAIVGQAPGSVVHRTGIPWDDKSGERLRAWLGVSNEQFYNPDLFALIPMGFCYPGRGKSGDLPPRPECAPQWHERLFEKLNDLQLTILIGDYAQKYYLQASAKPTLTETVKHYTNFLPQYLPLVHPSPRNNIWLKRNAWFEDTLVLELQSLIKGLV